MATRLEVQTRRLALYNSLKAQCTDGALAPGTLLPAVRELSDKYEVSSNVVFQVIQGLADEGFLYTVPRVGAFVGRPQKEKVEPYLLIVPYHTTDIRHHWRQTQAGFEDRIAQLGGYSIALTTDEAIQYLKRHELPALSGVFVGYGEELREEFLQLGVPLVHFGRERSDTAKADYVNFDNVAGGAMAVHHLWQNGHRSIGFLPLHSEQGDPEIFWWSAERMEGWKQALEQFGCSTAGLAFYPSKTSTLYHEQQAATGREGAQQLVGRTDVSAVIAANMLAAQGLIQAFQEANWPTENWPSIVCFDEAQNNSVMSYVRLPWEEIGREAAQTLWERHSGRLTGPAVSKLVSMRLIPRLTCRSDWTQMSGMALRHLMTGSLT